MRTILGTAIGVASICHHNQTDKGGKAYILHPLRMMMRLRTDDEELMCIAILHDCIEDSELTLDNLRSLGFSQRVIAGVLALTRRDDESYEDFIKRCGRNSDARKVKIEDLRDNSDITRLKGLQLKDHDRIEKYSKSYTYLKGL